MRLSIRASLAAMALTAYTAPAWAVPIVGGCQILPTNNYWNTPVDTLPVHTSSAAWITSIGGTQGVDRRLHADWGNNPDAGGTNEIIEYGIPFMTVSNPLPSSTVTFQYFDESDPGPYPIPTTAPIEGGPSSTGDRHVIAIDTSNCILYELFSAYPAGQTSWNAGSGARWPLNSNASRPDGWTSADAAGLAIFPGLVRWEEVEAGEIAHAIRFTAPNIWGSTGTGNKYIWPARHWSGSQNNPNLPPMGARVRLKASFNILGFDTRTQVILRAFKKYGMVLVDGGSSWYFQGMSNVNWPDIVISQLNNGSLIRGSDFEVVDTLPLQIDPNSEQSVQAPGAPTGVTVTPGNGQASFSFVPPVDSGGKPVIDYTVTCNPGARTATAPISPITLTGLTNGVALTCSVAARNLVFTGAASATVNVTPGQGVLAAPASIEGYNNPVGGGVTIPITVTNTGSGNTSALSVNLSGPGVAPYSQTSTCSGQSLAPGGSCTIDLTFTPQAIGTYVAYLTISGATTSPVIVTITLGAIDTPGAPAIGNVVAGNGQAWVFFSPPASNGGSPITFYRAMCLPASGSVMADGTSSPILVTGMVNNDTYSCYVLAANMAGNGPLSAAVNVTPSTSPSFGLIGVKSRKFHSGVQDFDVAINSPVAINGPVSVEPRAIGAGHRIVFQFNGAINAPGMASAVNASGSVDVASQSSSANEVIVTLTGIADNQRVTVSLTNVNGIGANAEASLGFLVGDVNGTRKVNASDISGVKARMGPATNTNFRFDLNTSGNVTLQDVSVVKSRSGLALP